MEDTASLEAHLISDAQQEMPPFGAKSVRLAKTMGTAATPALTAEINKGEATAFLALEALRESDPTAYAALPPTLRASIYVKALQGNRYYNAWGVPGIQITETGKALIDLGNPAVPLLAGLLKDNREAPLAGSKDATISHIYGNRVCDYAWLMINEILGSSYPYERSPAERDRKIATMLEELAH